MEEKDIIKTKELSTINPQKLAFLGDAVYELLVRYNIVKNFQGNIGELNSIKTKNVCCSAQSDMYEKIKDILTPKETAVYKWGRNAHTGNSSKKRSSVAYHRATGLEALFGYLYLNQEFDRIQEFVKFLNL